MGGIGRSTDPSTATHRDDVSGSEVASFRYNNPSAQYPSPEAARFGQTGYGIIGGGHKIARFPSPVNGAAANFDLLNRNYTGMTIGAAGTKWTGAHGFGVPGYNPDRILTKQTLDDPDQAIALLKAIARRESGHGNNLTEEEAGDGVTAAQTPSRSSQTHGDGGNANIRCPCTTGRVTGPYSRACVQIWSWRLTLHLCFQLAP